MRLRQPAVAWVALGAAFFAWLFGGDLPLGLAYFLGLAHLAAFLAVALDRTVIEPAAGEASAARKAPSLRAERAGAGP
ncbi:MAG: hypothetical protein IRZ11_08310, partial [Clostridia bacterium]|nr:hypothetical protein [Clostridia bacterium]